MLYLTRKIGETIVINKNIFITISEIKGNKLVKIGCQFPHDASILRKEIHDKISQENLVASNVDIDMVSKIIRDKKENDHHS